MMAGDHQTLAVRAVGEAVDVHEDDARLRMSSPDGEQRRR
jgi:hypothetical protein